MKISLRAMSSHSTTAREMIQVYAAKGQENWYIAWHAANTEIPFILSICRVNLDHSQQDLLWGSCGTQSI